MERQRVVVIGHRLMRDLVTRLLAGCDDIDVVLAEPGTHPTRAVDETGACFVILGNGGEDLADACVELLNERPQVRALTIVDDGHQGVLFEMRPHRVRVSDLSAEALAAAVRQPAHTEGRP